MADVVKWLRQTDVEAATGKGVEKLEEVRTRKVAAEAEIAELDLRQRKGELVEVAVVEKVLAGQIAAARSGSSPGRRRRPVAPVNDTARVSRSSPTQCRTD